LKPGGSYITQSGFRLNEHRDAAIYGSTFRNLPGKTLLFSEIKSFVFLISHWASF